MFRRLSLTFTASIIPIVFAWNSIPNSRRSLSLKSQSVCSPQLRMGLETAKFLNPIIATEISNAFQTPVFVYDEKTLVSQAGNALAFPNNYGLTGDYSIFTI